MRRLTRSRSPRHGFLFRLRRGERGAIATIFAVVVAGGVVMGMLALSVDIGNVMYERRQLQNGADAASLALASECANDLTNCAPETVSQYLDLNAGDDAAAFASRGDAPDGVCGRETGGVLPVCSSAATDALITDLKECPPLPDWLKGSVGSGISYVEAYSLTETQDGNTILPKYFSQTLAGGGPDTTVTACARAAWGPAGTFTATIPLTISSCEWLDQTNNGANYVSDQPVAPKPGYGGSGQPAWPGYANEAVVQIHDPGDDSQGCDWNGKDTAGGFGWVDSENCTATVTTDGWAKIDTGNDTPSSCKDIIPNLLGTAIALPVFDCLTRSMTAPTWDPATSLPPDTTCDPTNRESGGANSWYHIDGWAKFYISGYKLSGGVAASVMPGGHTSCPTPGGRCIFGWFLKGELDAQVISPPGSGGTDYGTYVVLPAG